MLVNTPHLTHATGAEGRAQDAFHGGAATAAACTTSITFRIEADELRPSAASPLFTYSLADYDVMRDGRFLIARRQLNPEAPPSHRTARCRSGLSFVWNVRPPLRGTL